MIRRVWTWAHGKRRRQRVYSPVGIAFHWSMAALVFWQLWLGWNAGQLPVGAEKLHAYQLHSQLGVLMLVLVILRGAWRIAVPGPINDADKPGWQSQAAHITHYVFYICLVGLPLSGWAMWSATAAEQPLSIAGALPWPMLPLDGLSRSQRYGVEAVAEWVHFGLIWTLLILIPLHAGAALKHHFIDRDDVLVGMLPHLPKLERAILKALRRIAPGRRSHDPSGAD